MQPCSAPLPTLASTPREQGEMALMVRQCFDVLDTYGKSPEQLANIIKSFLNTLAEYPFDKIKKAFTDYLKRNSKMPTPADIVRLVDPQPEPLSKSVYIGLQDERKRGEYLTPKERQYIKDYESQEMKKSEAI